MSDRPIGVKFRADLQVSHQKRDGVDRAVIKDPHTLRYFELAWDDYQLAQRIEPAATAADIAAHWQRTLPELCAGRETAELERRAERLCTALRRLGLADLGGVTVHTQPAALTWNAWALRWIRRISAPLFVRFRLFDPDELLTNLVVRWRPLFSLPALLAAALFVAISAVACLWHLGEMQFHPEWFAVWQNLAALYLGILVLKVIHECGHAFVCKALGGSVHEVGAQLLAFHPTFFVDVSDTWMWPDRRRRIAVAAAGFCAEIIAAAVLFWLWRLLSEGFARDLCLNLMFIASVSALLFNANPLMRYDGYHMLADFAREPRLRQSAFAALSQAIRRFVFGPHLVPRVAPRKKWLFFTYGMLSSAYLVWIAFIIGGFLQRLLAPYGLEFVGKILLTAWLASLALPLVRFIFGLARDTTRIAPPARRRPILIGASFAALLVLGAFAPLPISVERECVIEASAAGAVRASQSGLIAEIYVREGEHVRAGQPVVRLRSRKLSLAQNKAALEVDLAKVEMLSALGENLSGRVQQTTRRLNEVTANAAGALRNVGELQLFSPCDGVVATQHLERKLGRLISPGEEVLAINETGRRQGILPLTEKEARRIRDGAAVFFQARAFPGARFPGVISAAPLRIASHDLPRALTALAGGSITVDASGAVASSEVTHVSHFQIDPADSRLRPGLTGRARLDCGHQPLAQWLAERTLDAIHLDHRL